MNLLQHLRALECGDEFAALVPLGLRMCGFQKRAVLKCTISYVSNWNAQVSQCDTRIRMLVVSPHALSEWYQSGEFIAALQSSASKSSKARLARMIK